MMYQSMCAPPPLPTTTYPSQAAAYARLRVSLDREDSKYSVSKYPNRPPTPHHTHPKLN